MKCDLCHQTAEILYEGMYDIQTRLYCEQCAPAVYKKKYRNNKIRKPKGSNGRGKIVYNKGTSKYGGIPELPTNNKK